MNTQQLYSTATASYGNRQVRFPVATGTVETPDGTIFDTSMSEAQKLNQKHHIKYKGLIWPKGSMDMLDRPQPKTTSTAASRKRKKLARQNRRKGRK